MRIEIPDKTAADLKAMLARQGEDCDLEAYVQRTLSKRLLREAVDEMRASTEGVDPSTIDEAVSESRKAHQELKRREQGPDADC